MHRACAAPRQGSMAVTVAGEGQKWAAVMDWGCGSAPATMNVKARARGIVVLGFGEIGRLRIGRGMQEWCWCPSSNVRTVSEFDCAL